MATSGIPRRPASKPLGVWCVEGEWSDRPQDEGSVRHLLALLEDWEGSRVAYHRAATRDAFELYLRRWRLKRNASYEVLYIAAHGAAGEISVADGAIPIEELAELLAGSCQGRVIYFGSCSTLRLPERRLADFRQTTGARAVVGYTRDVGWTDSAAFDLLQLSAIVRRRRWSTISRLAKEEHGPFAERLGFRVYPAG